MYSTLGFLSLPNELKCKVLGHLDIKSLLRMSSTCKAMHEVIYATETFKLSIEMIMSELHPAFHIGTTTLARSHLKGHLDARLSFPVERRPCVSFPAPEGVCIERLFQGLFACIDEDSILHVWNIQNPDPSHPPPKILSIEVPTMVDFVIEPDFALLVLLCHDGGDHARILLLDMASESRRLHPWARTPQIAVQLPPGVNLSSGPSHPLLKLSGELLALVYHIREGDDEFDCGIVWDWRSGTCIYDSDEHESSRFHDLQLLPHYKNSFIVAVCTFTTDGATRVGSWIELRQADLPASTSHLVAEFHFPEFQRATDRYMGGLKFDLCEPARFILRSACNENIFPFMSNPYASVHILHIWYCSKAGTIPIEGSSMAYLVISNKAFHTILGNWATRDLQGNQPSFPLLLNWQEWGPRWTSLWDHDEFGTLTGTSSVCGTRIYNVSHPQDDFIELRIVDFNMNFPCSQRDCNDPFAHFIPKKFRGGSIWTNDVHTWLPFHIQRRYFRFKTEDTKGMMCPNILMDEARLVLSFSPDEINVDLNPTMWKVIHLVVDQADIGENCLNSEPFEDDEFFSNVKVINWVDQICRLCKVNPHTDVHILLECSAHDEVVTLRQSYTKDLPHDRELHELWQTGRLAELFNNVITRRDPIRMAFSTLAVAINEVYKELPSCSQFLMLADQQNPASKLFVTEQVIKLY